MDRRQRATHPRRQREVIGKGRLSTMPPQQGSGTALRFCRTGSMSVLLAIGIGSCFHSSGALRQERRISYWEALAELHPAEAIASARTPSEREFAEALGNLMSGDLEVAEQRFGKLRGTATDSIIRAGSRVIYTATLQYQEKWAALAVLKNEPSQWKADRADKASIELWAEAFKNVPPKTFTFRSVAAPLSISVSKAGTPLRSGQDRRQGLQLLARYRVQPDHARVRCRTRSQHHAARARYAGDRHEHWQSTGKSGADSRARDRPTGCSKRADYGRRRIDDANA